MHPELVRHRHGTVSLDWAVQYIGPHTDIPTLSPVSEAILVKTVKALSYSPIMNDTKLKMIV